MNQLLDIGWWFSFFGESFAWWFFCLVVSIVALPLTLRCFRGLADSGASLSQGIGLIVVNYVAWILSLEGVWGGREASVVRITLAVVACGFLLLGLVFTSRGYAKGRGKIAAFVPAALFLILALVPLPHGKLSIYAAVILLAVASIASWLPNPAGFFRAMRRATIPFLFAQVLFLIAFLFFVNVRSYLPWATIEGSLHMAEKWGNFTHLGSVMSTDTMPPKDLWFNGEPTNYYYGGHLLVGTLAKASGYAPKIAFNLGLATVFALTFTMGFGFVFSLVHLASRKRRLVGPLVWHSGMAWGVFGALAIAMFGNLDAWRQLLTREMDGGVQIRWERREEKLSEDWKLKHLLQPEQFVALQTAVNPTGKMDRPQKVRDELSRVAATTGDVSAELLKVADNVDARIAGFTDNDPAGFRKRGDAIRAVVRDGNAVQALKKQNAENAVTFQEEIALLIHQGKFEEVSRRYRKLAETHNSIDDDIDETSAQIAGEMDKALDSKQLTEVLDKLGNGEKSDEIAALLKEPAVNLSGELGAAKENRNFAGAAKVLERMLKNSQEFEGARSDFQGDLQASIRGALEPFSFDPMRIVHEKFGSNPRIARTKPDIREMWLEWPNVAVVDFWAPSRAIKGTPPGVKEPGTITEFPYFSAMLGDLHPHHMAIPFCLAALCACLSLFRKNSRLKRGDRTFFLRSWPELLGMAFFIGAVFPVNIWDAVVLTPIYGMVLLVARKGVLPAHWWRWVGFGGFMILLAFLFGIPANSIPGITPFFQNFKIYILAVALLAAGIPVLLIFLANRAAWLPAVICVLGAAVLVFAGPFLSIRNAGGNPDPAIGIAIRDLLAFAFIATVAATWTFGGHRPIGNWWYSAGGCYALVGGLALAVILPFQLYFHSPLQPEGQIFSNLLPPIIAQELKSVGTGFWATFWKSSPVNPFDQILRTALRDFVEHWGIFFFPILFLAIGRFFKASRFAAPGMTFMVGSLALAFLAFGRNYLGFWAGAISLAMMVLCIYYAFAFSRRAESPAWAFLAVAFFWTWFVEALHFDDDYAGNYERYNTPFKIYYPIWAIFAGGMVVALREMLARRRIVWMEAKDAMFSAEFWTLLVLLGIGVPVLFVNLFPETVAKTWFVVFWVAAVALLLMIVVGATGRDSRWGDAGAGAVSRVVARWPALLGVFIVGSLGMYYPISATATRTREFFTWPIYGTWEESSDQRTIYMDRTLDALWHLGNYPKFAQDYKAWTWIADNLPDDAKILERAGDVAYSHIGRISTGSSHQTVIGWKHHEHQWRGRAKVANDSLKYRYYQDTNPVNGFTDQFRTVMPNSPTEIDEETAFKLRMAHKSKRMKMLVSLYPDANLGQLYRLLRIVEKNDVSMQMVMDTILGHVRTMYTSTDKNEVAGLMGRYGIDYVVVGKLERDEYGQDLLPRLTGWNFETVYNSTDPQYTLPLESSVKREPTYVLKVPGDFAIEFNEEGPAQ